MNMRRLLISVLLLTAGLAFAQPGQPHFEVVSIKPCKAEDQNHSHISAGRLTHECISLDHLIREVYVSFADGITPPSHALQALRSQKFKGAPPWIAAERFTINAKADGLSTQFMMQGPMLRPVLEDRFQLKIHREPREIPIYELVVSGTPKLTPSKPGACIELDPVKGPPTREKGQSAPPLVCGGSFYRNDRIGGLDHRSATMQDLCILYSFLAERDVIDKTHLTGRYDLHLDGLTFDDVLPRPQTTPGDAPANPVSALNSALRKLGLKLQPSKMTADFIVIDHVERPTQN